MRHLKKYNSYKYGIGDYVLFKHPDTQLNLKGQIIDIEKGMAWPYRVCYFEEMSCLIYDDEIIRRLTSEEIEDFEIKKSVNKYNI